MQSEKKTSTPHLQRHPKIRSQSPLSPEPLKRRGEKTFFLLSSPRRLSKKKRKSRSSTPQPQRKATHPLLYLTNTAFVTVKLRKPSEKGEKGVGGVGLGAPIQGWGGWTREKTGRGGSPREKKTFFPLVRPMPDSFFLAFHAYYYGKTPHPKKLSALFPLPGWLIIFPPAVFAYFHAELVFSVVVSRYSATPVTLSHPPFPRKFVFPLESTPSSPLILRTYATRF